MDKSQQINQSMINEFDPANMSQMLDNALNNFNAAQKLKEPANIAEVTSITSIRNKILNMTDWMVMPDSDLSEEELSSLKSFRQALREAPQTEGFYEKGHANYLKLPAVPNFKYDDAVKVFMCGVEIYEESGENFLSDEQEKTEKLEEHESVEFYDEPRPEIKWEKIERAEGETPPPIGSEMAPKRARDKDGKFIPDDPSTPDYNEAWEGGKAPE
tara:strand:- start:28138 stop:28782 length:645 start_codon:yes stop_codon:yes gene_type:complete